MVKMSSVVLCMDKESADKPDLLPVLPPAYGAMLHSNGAYGAMPFQQLT